MSNRNTQAVRAIAPQNGGRRYQVASTTNLLEPLAGTYVTKDDLQELIVRGVTVTIKAK